ncbi:SusF/SusE family outer membrane protein [Prolixibacter denitrificans]|nr:SusF/SusE family outer membrane protein [Prolixibacter denitrificans]PSK84438.1 uncharacterized protein DUF5019 [Prolixibacter denitrificans]
MMIASFVTAAVVFAACTKEMSDVRLNAKLTTTEKMNVTSDSATVVGFIVSEGQGITEKGICYSTDSLPTVDDNKAVYSGNENTAAFTVKIGGLDYATKYYARAYGVTASGTIYGEQLTFTTLPVVPTVTTADFTATSGTSATGGGSITNNGGAAVTVRGVCYSTQHNPTISNDKTTDGDGMGDFTSSLSGLSGKTTYYVRAYATNSAGTAYGNEVSFTTPEALVTLYAAGDFQGWDPAAATDSIMNDQANSIVRGFVYISNTNGFKFTSQRNWDGPNYGAGATAGTLSTDANAGNLNVPEAGYYYFELNLADMTYTATKTTWGVIGTATADAWNSDQPMTYSPLLKRWFATIPMTAGEYKFRANSSWDVMNLGAGAAADTLSSDPSAGNLTLSTAGTYSVMLNLSQPLVYTYALTTWSIIGSSTPGGDWSTDIDLTPGANNTWSVTANLTAGEFKFRANHGWDYNLGGTPSELSWGGANITVPADGNYTITLDLVNGTYTLTAN